MREWIQAVAIVVGAGALVVLAWSSLNSGGSELRAELEEMTQVLDDTVAVLCFDSFFARSADATNTPATGRLREFYLENFTALCGNRLILPPPDG